MATVMMDILVEGEKVTEEERFLLTEGDSNHLLSGCASAPHSRSSSFRNRPRPKLKLDIEAAQRPRTNSLPTPQLFLTLPDPDWMTGGRNSGGNSPGVRRVRSFKTTSKGIVNRGDSFKKSTHSLKSSGSVGSMDRLSHSGASANNLANNSGATTHTSSDKLEVEEKRNGSEVTAAHVVTPTNYRVLMMGSTGSGKSALTRQFMTSEYKGTYENSSPEVETDGLSVSVLLDGEESTLQFIDEEQHPDVDMEGLNVDAYVVVFSVTDTTSYSSAVRRVRKLRVESHRDHTLILVANKIDLARQRRVSEHEAKKLASKYDCRYLETSAALNHHVDELLVGILSQIRLKLRPVDPDQSPSDQASSLSRSKSPARAALSFFQKLFGHGGGGKGKGKPGDPLFVK